MAKARYANFGTSSGIQLSNVAKATNQPNAAVAVEIRSSLLLSVSSDHWTDNFSADFFPKTAYIG